MNLGRSVHGPDMHHNDNGELIVGEYVYYISQSLTEFGGGAPALTFSSARYLNFSPYTQHRVMSTLQRLSIGMTQNDN